MKPDHATPIDFFLSLPATCTPLANDILSRLSLPNSKQESKQAHLDCILSNLVPALHFDRPVFASRQKTFTPAAGYRQYTLLQILDALAAYGLVRQSIGYFNRNTGTGRRTRIEPTAPLARLLENIQPTDLVHTAPTIIFKDKKKKIIPPPDPVIASELEKEIATVNAYASEWQLEHAGLTIPTRLHRVFNNRSHSQGGRFYTGAHGYQSLPQEHRQRLTINGVNVCEPDYGSLHISLLYAENQLEPPPLPYLYEHGHPLRKLFKNAVNIALNARSKQQALHALINENQIPDTLDASTVFEMVIRHHSKVAHRFFKSHGLHLQFRDSVICSSIMERMRIEHLPCFPVHDSIITTAPHQSTLISTMQNAYKQAFNHPVPDIAINP